MLGNQYLDTRDNRYQEIIAMQEGSRQEIDGQKAISAAVGG